MCEDIISGIKLGRHYNSVALLGTNLAKKYYPYIIPFDKCIIFLDNDNSVVIMQSVRLKNQLSPYVSNVQICRAKKNPKQMLDEELRNI